MSCPPICCKESQKVSSESPSTVSDSEFICRFGFFPMHYRKGKLRKSIIRKEDLLIDKLSFWRTSNKDELETVLSKVRDVTPNSNENTQNLHEIFRIPVTTIRQSKEHGYGRLFHVLDDTCTGNGHDVDHCTVGICKLYTNQLKENDYEFREIRNLLFEYFLEDENRIPYEKQIN